MKDDLNIPQLMVRKCLLEIIEEIVYFAENKSTSKIDSDYIKVTDSSTEITTNLPIIVKEKRKKVNK